MTESKRLRPDASMTLITAVMENPLDPGYEAVAQERAAGVRRSSSWPVRIVVLLLAVITGMGIVLAAQQLRTPSPEGSEGRELLIEQIGERRAIGEELRVENATVREELTELQTDVLGPEAQEFLARTTDLEIAVGLVDVQGPGVVVTLEDSARAADGESEDYFVKDLDIQVVVNGLWSSGAESIAVNGHRLTNLTAIRRAGSTIMVDLQPLSSPYTIEAIGDPDDMRAEFARSAAQSYLDGISSRHGIPNSIRTEEDLALPGSGSVQLEHAEMVSEP